MRRQNFVSMLDDILPQDNTEYNRFLVYLSDYLRDALHLCDSEPVKHCDELWA